MTLKHSTLLAATILSSALANVAYGQTVDPAAQSAAATTPVAQSAPDNGQSMSSAPTEAIQDIIVTATKDRQSIQRVPASVVAISGEALVQAGITSPQGLEKFAPSGSLKSQGTVIQAFIRGVGSNIDNPNFQPGVIFNYNDVPLSRYGTMGTLFDLGAVEIISGPQGTLYGGSAAGGAINLNAERPDFDYAGSGSIEVGNYSSVHVGGAQNIRLSDTVALRGAINFDRHSGYQSNNFDSPKNLSGRVSLLAKPSDDFTAYIWYHGTRGRGQNNVLAAFPFVKPSNPWFAPSIIPDGSGNPLPRGSAPRKVDVHMGGARFDYDIGDATLSYIPGYVALDVSNPFWLPFILYTARQKEKQVTQELRLSANIGSLKFLGGLFYSHKKTEYYSDFNGVPIFTNSNQVNEGYSAYGQVIWSLADNLRLTAGGRVSRDSIDVPLAFNTLPFQPQKAFTFKDHAVHADWKVGVDYQATPDILLYATVQTGYIPFGYVAPVTANAPEQILPESRLLSFTVGEKAKLLDGRLILNNEVYYYIYKDFQVVSTNPSTGQNIATTAKRSIIYGNELTAKWVATDDDVFTVGLNLMDARYDKFLIPGVGAYNNNQMTNAPTVSLTVGYNRTFPLASGAKVVANVQSHYDSGHWGQFDHAPFTHQKEFTKTDFKLTYYSPNSNWNFGVFVRNIENSAVFGALNSVSPTTSVGFVEPPRTYGASFSLKWGG